MKTIFRQAGLPGFELGDYVKESIDFLRANEPPEGYYVGFSGGKDSIATFHLCQLAGVKFTGYFSCTRIDSPEIYAFIKSNYPQVVWHYPEKSFWRLIYEKMPPLRMMRWCYDELKKAPSRNIPLKYRIRGIRAEESVMRKKGPALTRLANRLCSSPYFTGLNGQCGILFPRANFNIQFCMMRALAA